MQSPSLFPIQYDDFTTSGRFFEHIIGDFSGDGDRIIIVSVNSGEIDPFTPLVHEIDRHTHVVFFQQMLVEVVAEFISAALSGTDLENEAALRTIGAISQKAINAFYTHINSHNAL